MIFQCEPFFSGINHETFKKSIKTLTLKDDYYAQHIYVYFFSIDKTMLYRNDKKIYFSCKKWYL